MHGAGESSKLTEDFTCEIRHSRQRSAFAGSVQQNIVARDGELKKLLWPGEGNLKIQTTRFGEIDIDEADVVTLPEGLVGFPELVRYVVLDHDSDSPFKWFQSLDDGAMAFIIVNPLTFKPDFTVEVTEAEISDLDISDPEDAVISVIVTIPSDPKKMSANLKAPLIFNLKNRRGKQLILKDAQYHTKHYIMDEMKKYARKDVPAEIRKAFEDSPGSVQVDEAVGET